MDWMFTDTTLALTSWLQMEDIFANVFCIKCDRNVERVRCLVIILDLLLIYCTCGIADVCALGMYWILAFKTQLEPEFTSTYLARAMAAEL